MAQPATLELVNHSLDQIFKFKVIIQKSSVRLYELVSSTIIYRMSVNFTNDLNVLNELEINDFFVGQSNLPSSGQLKKILLNGQHVVLAITNNQLVGFINAISDKTLSAYIPLLKVLPAYQKHGIGAELVKRMRLELQDYYMNDISCDDAVVPFYEKQTGP